MITRRARGYLIGVVGTLAAATATAAVLALAGTGSPASASQPNAKQALIQKQLQQFDGSAVAWDRAHPALARQRLQAAMQKLQAEAQAAQANYRSPGDRITDVKDAPFPPFQFQAQNAYNGTLNGSVIGVAAGCAATGNEAVYSCSRGAVAMWTYQGTAPSGIAVVGIFPAPTTSSLTVTAFHGTALTLRSSTGQTFIFSLTTHTFS